MAAPTSYPSYAYNATQLLTVIVNTASAFNALTGPGVWTTTPYLGVGGIPTDPGFTDTDIRLQQMLIEMRILNQQVQFGFNLPDDPVLSLRPDILANDSSLTS